MGSHLTNYLVEKGHYVSGIDNDFHSCNNPIVVPTLIGDIRNIADMEMHIASSDLVIHLAAQIHVDYSIKHPLETLDINVSGTLNVLELCRKYKVQCIIASTSEAYGSSQMAFMSERHPLDCQSPYGASKVAADRLAKSYIDTYGMTIQIIRNFNAFGPWQNDGSYGSVIARFAKASKEYKNLIIYGNGEQERDYMYIEDIVSAYDFIKDCPSGVYNFGTGETQRIKDIAYKILKLDHNEDSQVMHVAPRAGEVQRLCCDISKVKSLGWKSNTNFDRDLEKYIRWYNERH